MGDIADYLLEQAMGVEFDGDYDSDGWSPGPKVAPSCRYCGANLLTWRKKGNEWRLYSGNVQHVCQTAATPDDFTEVE